MATLPDPTDSLDAAGKALYEKMCAKRGRIDGMYRTMLHNPALTSKVSQLGTYLRFEGKLPGDIREAVILYLARTLNAQYEWVKHEPCARQENVPDAVITALLEKASLPADYEDRYQDVIRVAQCVLERHSIPESLQSRVEKTLSRAGVVELVALAGFYCMIAGVIFAFDVPLPEGATSPFPLEEIPKKI